MITFEDIGNLNTATSLDDDDLIPIGDNQSGQARKVTVGTLRNEIGGEGGIANTATQGYLTKTDSEGNLVASAISEGVEDEGEININPVDTNGSAYFNAAGNEVGLRAKNNNQLRMADAKALLGDVDGNINGTYLEIDDENERYILHNLPTVDPAFAGALWNDSGTLKISTGV